MADNFFTLVLYAEDVLEDGELLVEQNKWPAPKFPCWKFPRFSLNDISENECLAEFRLEIISLALLELLDCHRNMFAQIRTVANDIETSCLLLRRFAYPCRYSDLMSRFGRSVPEMSQMMG